MTGKSRSNVVGGSLTWTVIYAKLCGNFFKQVTLKSPHAPTLLVKN